MIITTALCLAIIGCTIKIEPIKPAKKKRYYSRSQSARHGTISKNRRATETGRLVTSEWLENYRELERKHGNYQISQDDDIKPEGDKFRVPSEVVNHYEDLVKTALPTPSP